MIKTTRKQRVALKSVFDRKPIMTTKNRAISYREFRNKVEQGSGCIMVQWFGMWLGIETDGYTHS